MWSAFKATPQPIKKIIPAIKAAFTSLEIMKPPHFFSCYQIISFNSHINITKIVKSNIIMLLKKIINAYLILDPIKISYKLSKKRINNNFCLLSLKKNGET